MKITEQVASLSRTVIIVNNGMPTKELSEFFEHIQNRVNLDFVGTGSPEGVITAPIGCTYRRLDGGAGTSFYVKESGTSNTGWTGK
jgi:hypothetical protein